MARRFAVFALFATLLCRAQSPPSQAAGYNLVFSDAFPSLTTCNNTPGCNWYDPGTLNFSAYGTITDPSGTYANLNWTSAQGNNATMMTTASENQAYYHVLTFGYFEASIAFNPATGSWPALWMGAMVPANYTGNYAEMDVFEWQSDTPTTGYATAHVWNWNGSTLTSVATNPSNTWTIPGGTDLAAFHSYGVKWTPTAITWYFDNQQVQTFSTASSPWNTLYAGQVPMMILLSVQPGCSFTYPCAGQVSPLNMQVQWVHVFQNPAGSQMRGVQRGTVMQ